MEELDKIINERANALVEKKEEKEFEYKPNEDKSLKDQAKDFVGTMAVSNAYKSTMAN